MTGGRIRKVRWASPATRRRAAYDARSIAASVAATALWEALRVAGVALAAALHH